MGRANERKIRDVDRVRQMEQQCAVLVQQMEELSQTNGTLLIQQKILNTWCDSFTYVQQSSTSAAVDVSEELSKLRQREQSLLQQLTAAAPVAGPQQQCTGGLLGPWVDTIAPPGDPMFYFTHIMSRPMLPDVETITAMDLAHSYKAMVKDLSVQVLLLESRRVLQPTPVDCMKELIDRHMHTMTCLVLNGRQSILEELVRINCNTLEMALQDEADIHREHNAIAEAIFPAISLTEQQEDAISHSMDALVRLMKPVMQEWQQLQHEVANSCKSGLTEASSSSHGNADGNITVATLHGRRVQLEAQQQRLQRLKVVMDKKYMLLLANRAWCVGCLTWVQFAKVMTLSWPYAISLHHFCRVVQQRQQQRLQQREQQQQVFQPRRHQRGRKQP